MTPEILAQDTGFEMPERYNASRLLWQNRREDRAILHDDGAWTYGELQDEAARIGNALLQGGAQPGERVLLLLDDHPVYPAAIMGAMRAGLVPMLINTLSTADLVRFYLQDSGATAAIASANHAALLHADQVQDTACANVFVAEERPWKDASVTLEEYPSSPDDMAFWMYSSGSTGKPKGVVHRHEDAAYTAHTYACDILSIGPGDICFSIPKIFFAYGFGNSVIFPFAVGATSVLLSDRPTPERCFAQIDAHRPTILFGLPTLYTSLVNDPGIDTVNMGSIRLCISAAEVLSPELSRGWRDRFGLPIIEGLGSTEMLHIYLSNDRDLQKPGSAGRAVNGYEFRLVTPDGRNAEIGEEGVMQVMGLSGARTYWNRPEKTAETMKNGWLDTGDRFVRDEDGYYFFKGRADDLVKVSGQWVYPLEIEWALNDHPQVREACVLAIPMDDGRTTIRAWVVPQSDGDESLKQELIRHTKARLLPHKYPRDIIFLTALPKTGTDKINRQALRNLTPAGDPT